MAISETDYLVELPCKFFALYWPRVSAKHEQHTDYCIDRQKTTASYAHRLQHPGLPRTK